MEWNLDFIVVLLAFIPVYAVIGFISYTNHEDFENIIIKEKPKLTQSKTEFEEIFGL